MNAWAQTLNTDASPPASRHLATLHFLDPKVEQAFQVEAGARFRLQIQLTILLGATGIVMVSTDTGIREVPPLIRRAAQTLGARGLRYFWFVVVPAAIPKIVDGLRLAWAFGWRALMAGELLTSVSGLGQLLSKVAKAQRLDQLLAIMLLIALIGIAIDGLIFKRLEHAVRVRWGLA